MNNKQKHYNQRAWLSQLRSKRNKIIYVNFDLPTKDPLESFSQATKIIQNSLVILSTLHFRSQTADIRSNFNPDGKVNNIVGYIATKENLADHILTSLVDKAFCPFTKCALQKKIKVVQDVPTGKPQLPKDSYPFQFGTISHSVQQSQEPHIVRMVNGELKRPIHVFLP